MTELDFDRFDALTFDCYGTLIDWERGILNALQPILAPRAIDAGEDALLERYARHEAALERGEYLPYRDVLAGSLRALCDELGFAPSDDDVGGFAASVGSWPAFADSALALRQLGARFKLGAITNCDDAPFAQSTRRLGVAFDWTVTAERARSYKPSLHNFELAFAAIGHPPERILHVAQSLYHDHVPAKRLGMSTVWIDRRHDREGFGATPRASATPDLTLPDMRAFAQRALAGSGATK